MMLDGPLETPRMLSNVCPLDPGPTKPKRPVSPKNQTRSLKLE